MDIEDFLLSQHMIITLKILTARELKIHDRVFPNRNMEN